ncbi:hypothetical protein [Microlunatus speluncae]|uniref:hypothetical protein n=1 Tax=Microlunatus speluncae TaxID=2594267 RepID=UPI00126660A0|nr:hypothetical protein [Microlunatus speluncae]
MAIITLTAAGGAPGATTTAVGLALCWPRSVILVDADPGAHQAVLAGFLAGQDPGGRGLVRVAEAHRDRRPLREVIIDQSLPLTGDEGTRRLFLPGFAKPGNARLFSGVWPELIEAMRRLDEFGIDVIIDLGRCAADGLPPALIERADLTAVVLRSSLRSVMSTRVLLSTLDDQIAVTGGSVNLGLIVIGDGHPYASREIAAALGRPVRADLALDPPAAEHLSDGGPRPRRFERSPLTRSLHTTAQALRDHCVATDELVER